MEKVRLTLDLSPRLNETVEGLARSRGTSKADVFRDAMELLMCAESARAEGFTVGFWEKDGNVLHEKVLVF